MVYLNPNINFSFRKKIVQLLGIVAVKFCNVISKQFIKLQILLQTEETSSRKNNTIGNCHYEPPFK